MAQSATHTRREPSAGPTARLIRVWGRVLARAEGASLGRMGSRKASF